MLIAHHNLLKPCSIAIDKEIPACPAPETPGAGHAYINILIRVFTFIVYIVF